MNKEENTIIFSRNHHFLIMKPIPAWVVALSDLPVPKAKYSTTPVTTRAISKKIIPTFGWKIIQEIENASNQRGIQISRAAIKIASPTAVLRNPPKRGMYPSNVVIGEKKIQIEITISKYEPMRIPHFKHSCFFSSS